MPLAYAGILHSSMPEMLEEGSIFYILYSYISSGCGLGCAADFSLLNLPKGKSLGRSKPATSSSAQAL